MAKVNNLEEINKFIDEYFDVMKEEIALSGKAKKNKKRRLKKSSFFVFVYEIIC